MHTAMHVHSMIEKACNNGQEVNMLKDPNIVAGTDVDTHTCPLPLTNLDSSLKQCMRIHEARDVETNLQLCPKIDQEMSLGRWFRKIGYIFFVHSTLQVGVQ